MQVRILRHSQPLVFPGNFIGTVSIAGVKRPSSTKQLAEQSILRTLRVGQEANVLY